MRCKMLRSPICNIYVTSTVQPLAFTADLLGISKCLSVYISFSISIYFSVVMKHKEQCTRIVLKYDVFI